MLFSDVLASRGQQAWYSHSGLLVQFSFKCCRIHRFQFVDVASFAISFAHFAERKREMLGTCLILLSVLLVCKRRYEDEPMMRLISQGWWLFLCSTIQEAFVNIGESCWIQDGSRVYIGLAALALDCLRKGDEKNADWNAVFVSDASWALEGAIPNVVE
jgi:hypothetical protein